MAGKNTFSNRQWLFLEMKPYFLQHLTGVICITLVAIGALIDPLILRWIIDVVIPQRNTFFLLCAAGAICLSFGGRVLLGATASRVIFHINQQFILRLRMRLLNHVNRLSANYHEQAPVGSTMYVMHEALDELGELTADFFPIYLRTIILWVLTIIAMAHLSASLTCLVLGLLPFYAFTIVRLGADVQKTAQMVQAERSSASGFLQEHLAGAIAVQLLARERFQARRAFDFWARLMRAAYARKTAEFFYDIWSTLIVVAGFSGVILYGGLQVLHNALTLGGLVAFYSYAGKLFDPIYIATEINGRFQRASACISQIREILDTEPLVKELPSAIALQVMKGDIKFSNVHFRYNDRKNLFQGLTLSIPAGQKCALVGESGSGKSTLAKLLTRVIDIERGSICIDGADIRTVTLSTLRRQVCFIPQRPAFFQGSVEENIRFGNRFSTSGELRRIAEVCVLDPILQRLPQGWKQPLGAGAALLSGGERQRVALARALLQEPRILILDESTSELDANTEYLVFQRLREYWDTTMLIITHRLAAITWVDQIVMMDEGRISEIGTHESLFKTHRSHLVAYR